MAQADAQVRDLVPTAAVAAQIAEAVLVPIYGPEVLNQKPFKVREANGLWVLDGTLHPEPGKVVVGGVVHIEISKKDGAIKNVIHGK